MTGVALITGAAGQLGIELLTVAPSGWNVVGMDVDQLDITDAGAVHRVVGSHRPACIINAAGFTAVDHAEAEEAAARRVNVDGARHLAESAHRVGAMFVHLSTDYVFSGEASRPVPPDAPPAPRSAYGRTKLEGEQAVVRALPEALIVRTAWLYASHGANFVRTMLRHMGTGETVRVVDDQVGTPTWARSLARAVWRAVSKGVTGVHHFTDAGVASWYDFAVAIGEEAAARGILPETPRVEPVPTSAFPRPAARPAFSVLDKRATWHAIGWTPPHWRNALRACLDELAAGPGERVPMQSQGDPAVRPGSAPFTDGESPHDESPND